MLTVMIICIVIIFIIIALAVITTSKAYKFEHKIDPSPEEKSENNS